MKRLALLVAMVMAMAVLAPAAFADEPGMETDDVETTEKELSAAQQWKAEMIAAYVVEILVSLDETDDEAPTPSTEESLDPTQEALKEVLALRATTGWGVVFKLMVYAAAGMDLTNYVTEDGGYALGHLRKAFIAGPAEDGSEYADLPYKNLGQLQKEHKADKPDKADKPSKPDKADKANKPDKANKKGKSGS